MAGESVVLEENYDENYEPTEDGAYISLDSTQSANPVAEIAEYAKFLGMDPAEDKDLLWIAKESLKAPLPSDWKPWYVQCLKPKSGIEQCAIARARKRVCQVPLCIGTPISHIPASQSEDGNIYYFNFQSGESVWDHPCDEHYKELYRKEKLKVRCLHTHPLFLFAKETYIFVKM